MKTINKLIKELKVAARGREIDLTIRNYNVPSAPDWACCAVYVRGDERDNHASCVAYGLDRELSKALQGAINDLNNKVVTKQISRPKKKRGLEDAGIHE
jgi:hypothetical protein